MAIEDILPAGELKAGLGQFKAPIAIIVGIVVFLSIAATLILQAPEGDELPGRVAVGYTQDGEALIVNAVACDEHLGRVTLIRMLDNRVVWEIQGTTRHHRQIFVVGQTASPLSVSQSLELDLQPAEQFRVEVSMDEVQAAEFILRDVPPIGVLHDGRETTTEGFEDIVGSQWCGLRARINLTGGLAAQLLILLALIGVAATAGYYVTFEKR